MSIDDPEMQPSPTPGDAGSDPFSDSAGPETLVDPAFLSASLEIETPDLAAFIHAAPTPPDDDEEGSAGLPGDPAGHFPPPPEPQNDGAFTSLDGNQDHGNDKGPNPKPY